jgi:hypothetical protein
MKTFNENLNISYDQFEPDELFFVFAHNFLRVGLPTAMRQALEAAVGEQILHEMKDPKCKIGYQAARSTYGKEQHLNYFEQFTITQAFGQKVRIYAEFANDPNHRIDAAKKHTIIKADDKEGLRSIMEEILHTYFQYFALKMDPYPDGLSYILEDNIKTLGFWFKHEHGTALLAIETAISHEFFKIQ